MTMTELRDYEQAAEQDKQSWLGTVTIFSVSETSILHTDLAAQLAPAGLDVYLPSAPKDENVFRRSFTDGVRRTIKMPTAHDPEACDRVMVRTLSRKKAQVSKRIVIEHVNVADENLKYEEVLEVKFDGDNPHLVNPRVIGPWHSAAWEIANEMRDEYLAERGCLDGNAIRALIRDVFEACRATALRPTGGVYFSTPQYAEKIEALARAAELIPGCLVHTVPLIDTTAQRANVKKAFELESNVELGRVLDEMRQLLKSGEPITEGKAAVFARESKRAKARMREYAELLNDGLDLVDSKLSIFDAVLSDVLSKVGD